MDTFLQDLRHAVRSIRTSPGFATVAILTLGLGVGASAALFSLVDAILIAPLGYPDSERIVTVEHAAPGMGLPETGQSDGTYLHYQSHNRAFEEMGLYNENVVNVSAGEGDPERVQVALVTHSTFSVLGASPALGRLLTAADNRPGAPGVVVIGHELWQRRFGGDPAIVGRTIELNSAAKEIVGVIGPGFDFPRPETQIWYASTVVDSSRAGFSGLYYSSIARLKPGVSAAEAEADLNRLIPGLADAYGDASPELLRDARLSAVVSPLKEVVVGEVGSALWLLLCGMGLVLLVACANVANLFLIRAERRQSDIAVRTALGAGRGDLARHFLTESVLLAALAGAVGVAIAWAGVRVLVAFGPETLPRLHEVGIDARVVAVAGVLALVTGLIFGLAPLARLGRPVLTGSWQQGGRRTTASAAWQRARRLLVGSQVAIALMLLVGSALMAQSLWRMQSVDPGFDPRGVLTLEIALPHSPYPDYESRAGLWHELLSRIRALPGVEAAGAVGGGLPLSENGLAAFYQDPIAIEGGPTRAAEAGPMVAFQPVTPGYFEAMGISLLEGRRFQPGDRAGPRNPVLVSAPLARRLFPGESALGKRVRRADRAGRDWYTVAAVVAGVREESVTGERSEVLYVPVLDRALDTYPSHMSLAIRTTLPPLSLAASVRRLVRGVDPDLPLARVRTMERIVADSMTRTSFTMALLLIAAAAAVFLGAVGLYGVIAYAVTRRTHEIGIRLALGARATQVLRMVVGQGAAVVIVGAAVGVLLSLALTRFLGSLLYQVSPTDPVTIAAMAALLFAVALLASYLPARRAARVDPMVALRQE